MTVCIADSLLIPKPAQPGIRIFSHAATPATGLRVSIVMPARNEEDNLLAALSALHHQVGDAGVPLDTSIYEVLLLINNSNDASLSIARQFQQQHPSFALHIAYVSLPSHKANIGTVRRILMDEACSRLRQHSSNGIIASTDSDTVVDRYWVHQIMQEIGKGADAVGGRILTLGSNSPVRLWHLRDVKYRTLLSQAEVMIDPCIHDPWPRHYQYFGASLAVTCAAYERAGRLPEVPFLEDYALSEALKGVDARIRRSNAVKVYTSDRQQGRVAVGFSEQLNTWDKLVRSNKIQLTEPVVPQIIKWKCRNRLRKIYTEHKLANPIDSTELVAVCRPLQLPYNWLLQHVHNCNYFGKLWQIIEQRLITNFWNEQWLPQPITEAIAVLQRFISNKD